MKLSIFPLLLLSIVIMASGEEPAQMTGAVKSILDKTEKDITKNKQTYDDANKKVFDAAEKLLMVELNKLTKAGRLDSALALKKIIDGMRVEIVEKNNLKSTDSIPDGIIGKWGNGVELRWEFKKGGIGIMNTGLIFNWEKDKKIDNVFNLSQLPGPDRIITVKNKDLVVEFVPSTYETRNLVRIE